MFRMSLKALLAVFISTGTLHAQTAAEVDFERDVSPILRRNCVACHGPAQQMNSYRLDRRSVALRRPGPIVVGSSDTSRLYLRLVSDQFGSAMPPTGRLKPEEIAVIKAWIDAGAPWPDALANEADLPPVDVKAVRAIEALAAGDRQAFMKSVADDPGLLNARGPEGSTPFMFAVLYSDASTLRQLLTQGADPNRRNDANATALIWAATDLDKTRVLLDAGADVNARSADARTPLFVAAGRPGGAPVVKLLLERGANANITGQSPIDTPLVEAAIAGNAETMAFLIGRGADTKIAGTMALAFSLATRCAKCADLVAHTVNGPATSIALREIASFADVGAIRFLLDRGADVNGTDEVGRTPLMFALASDLLPIDVVRLLIDRGANVNAKSRSGETPLGIARLRGNTPIVDLLLKSGATTEEAPPPALRRVKANTVRAAVERSLPLLQRADSSFTKKTSCVSCHNESLPAMTVSLARSRGVTIDTQSAAEQVKANVAILAARRERWNQGIPFVQLADAGIFGYVLVGLNVEKHSRDLNTDSIVMFLKNRQMPDGRWATVTSARPPLAGGEITQTALAMRALQVYAPKIDEAGYRTSVERAASWLTKAVPKTNEDRTWRLFGLVWAGHDRASIQQAVRELRETQRSDGGWSDIPTLPSGAYATGQALAALRTAGVAASDPAFQRGVQFLLDNQLEDGSWYVKTRALGFQPYFDNGFPHGVNQWISAAGTSWATMALTLALPESAGQTAAAGP
jgi:ankyrin repeat protein